jgi:hypothetical protein
MTGAAVSNCAYTAEGQFGCSVKEEFHGGGRDRADSEWDDRHAASVPKQACWDTGCAKGAPCRGSSDCKSGLACISNVCKHGSVVVVHDKEVDDDRERSYKDRDRESSHSATVTVNWGCVIS